MSRRDRPTRIGMITPSSNTVVEPTTMAVTAGLDPPLTTHYARIEVKTISLEADSLVHFQTDAFVRAVEISHNAAFADVSSETICDLVERADAAEAQALAIICTNLPAGWLVERLEVARHKPVFDSTLVTIWHALRLAGRHESIQGWGTLLRQAT